MLTCWHADITTSRVARNVIDFDNWRIDLGEIVVHDPRHAAHLAAAPVNGPVLDRLHIQGPRNYGSPIEGVPLRVLARFADEIARLVHEHHEGRDLMLPARTAQERTADESRWAVDSGPDWPSRALAVQYELRQHNFHWDIVPARRYTAASLCDAGIEARVVDLGLMSAWAVKDTERAGIEQRDHAPSFDAAMIAAAESFFAAHRARAERGIKALAPIDP